MDTRSNTLKLATGPFGKHNVTLDYFTLHESDVPVIRIRITYYVPDRISGEQEERWSETFLTREAGDVLCAFFHNWSGALTHNTGHDEQNRLYVTMARLVEGDEFIPAMKVNILCPAKEKGGKTHFAITYVNQASAIEIADYIDNWLQATSVKEDEEEEMEQDQEEEVLQS